MEENKIIEQNTITKNAEDLGLVVPKNMGDYVNNTMAKYIEQGLVVPKDYNVQNAVIGSYLIIQQDDKLKNCDKTSIASSLIDMAVLGLNASKGQCYFVPYNNKLSLQPSYFGKIMAIKRIKGVIDVRADVIYKDTEYELLVDEYGYPLDELHRRTYEKNEPNVKIASKETQVNWQEFKDCILDNYEYQKEEGRFNLHGAYSALDSNQYKSELGLDGKTR